MAKELIRAERFIELANTEIEAHRNFQPGMRISLGASLPNGSYEIEYHGSYADISAYEIRPFPLF
jgi:uncharacterized protein (DUF2344 family)